MSNRKSIDEIKHLHPKSENDNYRPVTDTEMLDIIYDVCIDEIERREAIIEDDGPDDKLAAEVRVYERISLMVENKSWYRNRIEPRVSQQLTEN